MYEFDLFKGHGARQVTSKSRDWVTVVLSADGSLDENKRFSGIIELDLALQEVATSSAYIACFKSGCGYRQNSSVGLFHWEYPPRHHTLAGLVEDKSVRLIMKDFKPWFVDLNNAPRFVKNPHYQQQKANNVVSLFSR